MANVRSIYQKPIRKQGFGVHFGSQKVKRSRGFFKDRSHFLMSWRPRRPNGRPRRPNDAQSPPKVSPKVAKSRPKASKCDQSRSTGGQKSTQVHQKAPKVYPNGQKGVLQGPKGVRGVFPCRVGWGVEPPYPEICRTFDPSFCRSFVRGLVRHTSYRRLAQGTWAGGLMEFRSFFPKLA